MSQKSILKSSDGGKDDDGHDHSKKNVTFGDLPKYDRPPKTVRKAIVLGWVPAETGSTEGNNVEASSTAATEETDKEDEPGGDRSS